MSRSINGNLLGKAAVENIKDLIPEYPWSRFPECAYWRSGAEWAKGEMYNIYDGLGVDDKINKILSKFYNENNTWMHICLRAEHMLSLIKAIREANNAT